MGRLVQAEGSGDLKKEGQQAGAGRGARTGYYSLGIHCSLVIVPECFFSFHLPSHSGVTDEDLNSGQV